MKSKQNRPDGPADGLTVRRAGILALTVTGLLAILLIRILILQTVEYDRYQQKVIDQITTQTEIAANRGGIYDRNGVALATNVTTYRVFISPSSISDAQAEMKRNGENIDLTALIADGLSETLDVSCCRRRQRPATLTEPSNGTSVRKLPTPSALSFRKRVCRE